jgi:hypothetical protein
MSNEERLAFFPPNTQTKEIPEKKHGYIKIQVRNYHLIHLYNSGITVKHKTVLK